MAINYKRHRRALEKLYEDRVTVSRYVKGKKPSGETALTLQPVHEHENIPCRLSQKALAVNGQTEAQNNIRYETKLFLAPEIEIRQGDVLAMTRAGKPWTYTAGEPFLYPTHQEILLQREDKA
ncbi:ABC transporter ATP-binding protein [Desulforamulus ruminis]|uniref:ABC transporter ATP-binding protein n=1 Tax=Desulforamulus ruminis TaxID=1564 RepID=UPI0023545BF0|nr:ABC transporter ATP-binding protein [Desulforamulus ruminis]